MDGWKYSTPFVPTFIGLSEGTEGSSRLVFVLATYRGMNGVESNW